MKKILAAVTGISLVVLFTIHLFAADNSILGAEIEKTEQIGDIVYVYLAVETDEQIDVFDEEGKVIGQENMKYRDKIGYSINKINSNLEVVKVDIERNLNKFKVKVQKEHKDIDEVSLDIENQLLLISVVGGESLKKK